MSDTRPCTILKGDIEMVVKLTRQIPEFIDPHGASEYHQRLTGVPHLILIAFIENQPVGFKVGYERDGNFYSWMGGVLPEYRKVGIAQALADAQEQWAMEHGYRSITFKTRNAHKAMLLFALKNGFDIIGFQAMDNVAENRILLRKELK